VFVANTFTMRWEIEPYRLMAMAHGAAFEVIDIFDGGLSDEDLARRNAHGVPTAAIANMRARYEHDWMSGNPHRMVQNQVRSV
jgi:hypothetical protein